MKIAIDVSPLTSAHAYRGIGVYTRELVTALRLLDSQHEIMLHETKTDQKFDLIHYPYFDFFFLSLPKIGATPTIVSIHDAIPLRYPQHYPRGVRGSLKFIVQKKRVAAAAAIITDSKASKKDIERWLYPDEKKIHTIYLAAPQGIAKQSAKKVKEVKAKYGISTDYMLYVGDINYNKNLPRLLEAYALSMIDQQLLLVSKAFAHTIPEVTMLRQRVSQLGIDKKVTFLSAVADEAELSSIYSGAYCYIQPSLYEGFGLPVLEAWTCEVPVLSSNGGSLAEIIGNGALVFNPNSLQSMISVIQKGSLLNKSERQSMVNRGAVQLSRFNWQKTARETLAVYEQALNEA